jgi:phosphopantothenoylcysteine synthetase/decarboxylase
MKVILGVSASVAIYKACDITRELAKAGDDVHVIMTRSASEWINPILFEALSGNPVTTDATASGMAHINVRSGVDYMLVAPATADLIARAAQGRADDILTATLLAYSGPRYLAAAMNPNMYSHPATQASLLKCREYGYRILDSANGEAVCGDLGQGKMMTVPDILAAIRGAV